MNRIIGMLAVVCLIVSGCAPLPEVELPTLSATPMKMKLQNFPPISNGKPITVAVYSFVDKTGQRKPSDKFANISTAVSQGGEIYLIKALMDLSDGRFFKVVERTGLDNLVKERQVIRNARKTFEGNKAKELGALQFAGVIIEGGIVGYDTNKETGGVGARIFGIGPQAEWRTDVVTVGLRVVSVLTGEVIIAVSTQKTILSTNVGLNIFKFFDQGTQVIETEIGGSVNEPINYALRQAIEKAVLEMVKEGKRKKLWDYSIPINKKGTKK